MNQEKIGSFIKNLRKSNGLTQKQLAEKLGVTYQAVSKWENGKSIPDIALLKQISQEFKVEIEEILEGKSNSKERRKISKKGLGLIGIFLIVLMLGGLYFFGENSNFEFKTLAARCDDFEISGSIAYNKKKTSIYISQINYCGSRDGVDYAEIDCALFESNGKVETEISRCDYQGDDSIGLEEFLQGVKINVDSYEKSCKVYTENSLYLRIDATDLSGKITSYEIPLSLSDNCSS